MRYFLAHFFAVFWGWFPSDMSVKAAGVLAFSFLPSVAGQTQQERKNVLLPLWMECAWKLMFVASFCWRLLTNHALLIYKKAEKWSRIVSKMSLFLSLPPSFFFSSFPPSVSLSPSIFLPPFPPFPCSLPPFPSSSSSIVKSPESFVSTVSPHFLSAHSSLPNVRLMFSRLPESSAGLFKRSHPSLHLQSHPNPGVSCDCLGEDLGRGSTEHKITGEENRTAEWGQNGVCLKILLDSSVSRGPCEGAEEPLLQVWAVHLLCR